MFGKDKGAEHQAPLEVPVPARTKDLPGHVNEAAYLNALKPEVVPVRANEHLGIDPADPTEEWRPMPGAESYYGISSKGRVKRIAPGKGTRAGRIIGQMNSGRNAMRVIISVDGQNIGFLTARLVAQAFLPPPDHPSKTYVMHIDGDWRNNRADNLRWATHTDTWKASAPGSAQEGNQQGGYPTPKKEREGIIAAAKSGMTINAIAATFGKSHITVEKIIKHDAPEALQKQIVLPDGFVSAVGAAKIIGVHHQKITKLAKAGMIPGAFNKNRCWAIPREWAVERQKNGN